MASGTIKSDVYTGLIDGNAYKKYPNGKTEINLLVGKENATPSVWVGGIYYYDLTFSVPSGVYSAAPTRAIATTRNDQWWVAGVSMSSATSGKVRLARPSGNAANILVSILLEGNSP